MKALVLASGLGMRLRPLTETNPKALVKVAGKTLLERIIEAVIKYDIREIVITSGHLGEKLRDFVGKRYPDLQVSYVDNPDYVTTNYIYSLWLARGVLKDSDILSFHADLLFDPTLIERLLSTSCSSVLVMEGERPSVKDFNARVENGFVTEIGVKLQGAGVSFCAPLYKLRQEDFSQWMDAVGQFVQKGKLQSYAEDAFNAMSPKFPLQPVFFKTDELCMEVDDFEDLEKAQAWFDHKK